MRQIIASVMIWMILIGTLIACGGVKPIPYVPTEVQKTEKDEESVRKAWDQMLRATNAGDILKVESKLGRTCERCATRLELDAERAKLLSDPIKMVVKLISAMSDPQNPHPSYTLWSLKQNQKWLHHKHSTELLGILLGMADSHPNLDTRRVAAYGAAELAHHLGDDKARTLALELLGSPLPLKIIGPFPNQHGRGFGTPYPPEMSWSSLHRTANGQGWISDMIQDPLGYYDLSEGLYDRARHVGYAAQTLNFSEAQTLSLRINASAPLKVWWNDQLIFESERFNSQLFDIISLPVKASQGINHLLIKIAEQDKSTLRVDLLNAQGGSFSAQAYTLGSLDEQVPASSKEAQVQVIQPSELIKRALRLDLDLTAKDVKPTLEQLYFWTKIAHAAGFDQEKGLGIERLLDEAPQSLLAQFEAANYSISIGEPGEGELKLAKLAKKSGVQLPLIQLAHADIALQQGNLNQYQNAVTKVRWRFYENMPIINAWLFGLAQRGQFGRMRQTIDYLKRVNPDAPFSLRNEVLYHLGLRKINDALSAAYRLKQLYPGDLQNWHLIARLEESRNGLDAQIDLWEALMEREPHLRLGYLKLAQAYATANELGAMEDLIERWGKIHPSDPTRFVLKAELLDRQMVNSNTLSWTDIKPQLADAWRSAFKTYQGDRRFLEQLSYFDQEDKLFWNMRLPNDQEIKELVLSLPKPKSIGKDVDIEIVRDLSIFKLYSSGPSVLRRLKILRAISEKGVDQLRSIQSKTHLIEGSSYVSVNRAYSINDQGKKRNPTSHRNGVLRFGQLKVGSVVILDLTHQRVTQSYFSDHFAYDWQFQDARQHMTLAEVEIWSQEGSSEFKVQVQGEVKERTKDELDALEKKVTQRLKADQNKRKKGFEINQKRSDASVSNLQKQKEEFEKGLAQEEKSLKELTEGWSRRAWFVQNRPSIETAPFAPYIRDRSDLLSISTVDSWHEVARWEKALLYNKFQMTPELKQKLKVLIKDAQGETEIVERILDFVRREIRYEQDYESTIAGVRPHSASLVFRRGYGDCKDQAVLFVTLAREAGLKAEIAILNTAFHERKHEMPSPSRFNHMIAYMPPQGDLKQERFIDPTDTYLDLKSTPTADQGADILVIYSNPQIVDGALREIKWAKVPLEGPEINVLKTTLKTKLNPLGDLEGSILIEGEGFYGSKLRSMRSNKNRKNFLKARAQEVEYGAQVTKVKMGSLNLNKTAQIKGQVIYERFGHLAKKSAKESMYLPIPRLQPWRSIFNDERRSLALTRLYQQSGTYEIEIELPSKTRVLSLPSPKQYQHQCFEFSFTPSQVEQKIKLNYNFKQKCNTISLQDYHEIRLMQKETYRELLRQGIYLQL